MSVVHFQIPNDSINVLCILHFHLSLITGLHMFNAMSNDEMIDIEWIMALVDKQFAASFPHRVT